MTEKEKETVLLVGDGDFSFSLDFIQQTTSNMHIVSSCLLTDGEKLTERQQKNVDLIKTFGGKVLTDVDATKLHEHPILIQLRHHISLVIFNFPHTGGKMKLGENRKLLKHFFISAGHILDVGKKVQVTLCSGQGGTASEENVRAWHNSWKVVEMATYGNFILTAVEAFNAEKYPSYKCVGYRSQEKGFGLKGAMVHTFQKSICAISKFRKALVEFVEMSLQENIYQVPYYFAKKLSLGNERWNPVYHVSKFLEDVLMGIFPHMKVIELSSVVVADTQIDTLSPENVIIVPKCDTQRDENTLKILRPTLFNPSLIMEYICDKQQISNSDSDSTVFLRCKSYKNCMINSTALPIEHGIVIAYFGNADTFGCTLHQIFKEILIFANSDRDNANPRILISLSEHDDDLTNLFGKSDEIKMSLLRAKDVHKIGTWHQLPIEIVIDDWEPTELKRVPFFESKGKLKTLHFADIYRSLEDAKVLCVCIKVDLLAMCKYHVNDWRTLWSDEGELTETSGRMVYSCRSLYPPVYVHDISFWESASFNHSKLMGLIRNVAEDLVKEVKLIDTYICPKTRKTSYCYRIWYQSVDYALGKDDCRDIQQYLREQIASNMKVKLR